MIALKSSESKAGLEVLKFLACLSRDNCYSPRTRTRARAASRHSLHHQCIADWTVRSSRRFISVRSRIYRLASGSRRTDCADETALKFQPEPIKTVIQRAPRESRARAGGNSNRRLAAGAYGRGRALVIEIPRGLFGLHMIKNRRAFIVRTSAGKSDLDVNEIRAAFVGAEAAVRRLSEFRADRTANILNGNALWPLSSSRVGVIHLLPLASFASGYNCEIDKISQEIKPILYPIGRRPPTYIEKFTFDGYANQFSWSPERGALHGYTQLFRNGTIENVNAGFLDPYISPADVEGEAANLYWLEIQIMDCAERMLKIMKLLEIPGPFYLLVALLNVKGLKVTRETQSHFRSDVRTIDLENLILPEVLFESADVAIESGMRSSFDMIWNACGWPRSFSYDEHGAHKKKDWRKFFHPWSVGTPDR
jgi:hypothetical protein